MQRVAEVHFEAGYVPAHHDRAAFAQALRAVGEPVFGRPAGEVSMGRLLAQLFEITALFDMRLRPELVLLQKTMVTVEGVARRIDPEHDIWAAAEPVVAPLDRPRAVAGGARWRARQGQRTPCVRLAWPRPRRRRESRPPPAARASRSRRPRRGSPSLCGVAVGAADLRAVAALLALAPAAGGLAQPWSPGAGPGLRPLRTSRSFCWAQ